jgi:hypothetical protein
MNLLTFWFEPIRRRLRRSKSIMQLYRSSQIPTAHGRLRIDEQKLATAKRNNRRNLDLVSNWIDLAAFDHSVGNYGIMPQTLAVMEKKLGPETTYSDLMACICGQMLEEPNYLEIGVSVGKNFWQILNSSNKGRFWAFDIENISPALEQHLELVSRESVATNFRSLRDEPPYVARYNYGESLVTYCAGDVLDEAMWDELDGQKFSLIFSDAFHDPDAVRWEWKQISERDLLDQRGFTMFWDDLGSKAMRKAFSDIVADCRRRYNIGPTNACLTHVRGWVGIEEPFHPVGIISTQGFVA